GDPSFINDIKSNTELIIYDPPYLSVLQEKMENLKNFIKATEKLKITKITKENDEEDYYYENFDTDMYYDLPTIFLYPYFLDKHRIEKYNAGVLQYATQNKIAIVIHKQNKLYKEWISKRSLTTEKLTPTINNETLTIKKAISNLELDCKIGIEDTAFSIQWLKKLISHLTRQNISEIHSIRSYVFKSLISQFAKEHFLNYSSLVRIFSNESNIDDLAGERNPLKNSTSARINTNKILLLDPADASGESTNGKKILKHLSDLTDYDIVYVTHGLNIPVGVGYSLYCVPFLLRNNNWEKIQKFYHDSILESSEFLEKIGIEVTNDKFSSTTTNTA
ncbi:MAG: hypothetical protein QM535_21060, partial [Limnohabitans sp.]|nr:hypothetical protein [Limnohabitans sp.]